MGKYPENRVILASYNDETAERFTRRNKEKIRQFGKTLFGVEINKAVDRSNEFELIGKQGRMISRGIMGGITSNPANLILIDDPIKNRQEADSDTFRDRVWEEWQNSIKTRLAVGAKVIIIMTRWHEDDLAGRVIANENNVTLINLPCEAESNDPLGRAIGDALFPEIGKNNEWLKEFKAGYQSAEGTRAWLALFQGRPTAVGGNILNVEWWKYYDSLPEMVSYLISVDAAFKDGATNDFTCIQAWGKRGADMYLLDMVNEHLDFPATLEKIRRMKARYSRAVILIEDKANGSAIIQVLRRSVPGVVPVNPEGGKVARVNAVSHAIESGNVWLPSKASWLSMFIDQCTSFPNGKNDDAVDAMSQALNRFMYFSGGVASEKTRDRFLFRSTEESEFGEVTDSFIGFGVK
jgi:predicted phage terminase large subunit-like protein